MRSVSLATKQHLYFQTYLSGLAQLDEYRLNEMIAARE
jgi:hypothetical protein